MDWLDELISQKHPNIPFEVYTYQDRVSHLGVRNLTCEIIVHYPGEIILYGPASYKDCCEFAEDVKDVVLKSTR